ncbi:hypothetical protein TNCV_4389231 [Trichonephila clavipes]|nr:hypothetical protein TNCV_4389231 [Trichonephila clavipes]
MRHPLNPNKKLLAIQMKWWLMSLAVVPKYSVLKPEEGMDVCICIVPVRTATAGSDVVQSGRPIFDDFSQHLWPYIGNNTANVVFQMVKRLWLIRIDQ